MNYTVDVEQLLNLWTVIRILGEIREIPDETGRSDVLTEVHRLSEMTRFDA